MLAAQKAETHAKNGVSQLELTSHLLRNLYKFDLTPVTKLVLLELTSHLNENTNGLVVFPSIGYIAEVLGIGLTAAKKAINDLIMNGLIIKSKRNKVRGNCNKYLFTQKVRNLTLERSQNELFKRTESDLFMITDNNEQIKNKPVEINTNRKTEKNRGGNVYSGDDEILVSYAVKHNAKNINAYILKLKETKSAEKIIKEYKNKQFVSKRAENLIKETQETLKLYESYKRDAVPSETCAAWVELGKKLGYKKKL